LRKQLGRGWEARSLINAAAWRTLGARLAMDKIPGFSRQADVEGAANVGAHAGAANVRALAVAGLGMQRCQGQLNATVTGKLRKSWPVLLGSGVP
jgi:hypothetical protein